MELHNVRLTELVRWRTANPLTGVRIPHLTHIAGREVSHRSHKPSVLGSIPSPATYGVYSVMVARQIVVLLVWVRTPLFTPNRELPKLVKGPHC